MATQLPVFIAAGTAVATATSASVSWPTHVADDIALLVCESTATPVATPSGGWAHVGDSPQDSAVTVLTIFWLRATSAAMSAATITSPSDHIIGQILTFRLCAPTGNPWDVTAGDQLAVGSVNVNVPGDTTTVNDCLIVAAVSNNTDTTGAQTSAWANADLTGVVEIADSQTDTGGGGGFGVAAGVKATAGAYAVTTATLANGSRQGRISIALKGAASVAFDFSGNGRTGSVSGAVLAALAPIPNPPRGGMMVM